MCRSYIAVHYWMCFSIQDACDIDPWCNRISRAEGSLAVRMTFGRRRSSTVTIYFNLPQLAVAPFKLHFLYHPSMDQIPTLRAHFFLRTLNILNDLQVSSQNTYTKHRNSIKVKSIVIHGHSQMVAFAALLERSSSSMCSKHACRL